MDQDLGNGNGSSSGELKQNIEVVIPACFSDEIKVSRNIARQMIHPSGRGSLDTTGHTPVLKRQSGETVPLVARSPKQKPALPTLILKDGFKDPVTAFKTDDDLRWIGKPAALGPEQINKSWIGAFAFVLGDREANTPGLRLPQLGAVHAVLGFWTTGSTEPATVVMPTGTGKTETMIALLVTGQPERLLVAVPSDVLRTQIASKFESLGVLQESGVVHEKACRPVVGQLKHGFQSVGDAQSFAEKCNVIVTTPAALFAGDPSATEALLGTCSHLFVDEAHHVEAATWRRIRDAFEGKPVVQFTATPYREDGHRIAGKIIYSYPLREAQKHEYFSRINYKSVVDFSGSDRAIALAAIDLLRKDLAAGYDHLLFARVNRIGRAQELKTLYESLAPDLVPVVLHSSLPVNERKSSLQAVYSRKSKVIVCVDMLGEGFDLPSLKIAAIHDLHKSLGVTLQFVGRFARASHDRIGEASVVTGRPQGHYDENLRRLYSEEPDWNLIVRDLSEAAIGEQTDVGDFEAEFRALPEQVSLRNIEPRMSTVVYRTKCETWKPEAIYDLFPEDLLFTDPIAINQQNHIAWFVLEVQKPVRWGQLETVADTTYELYVIYWDEEHQLLYINSSNTEGVNENLARAVCGEDVQLFTGEAVYRVMANIDRLVPTNVGLLDNRNRSRRFSMHVGADVVEGFPVAEAQTKTQTNIFAYGYEDGSRVSIGGSLKGRIWSYRAAPTLRHWMHWCDHIGSKVSDSAINVDDVMRGFIRPKVAETRPPFVVIGLEWPWEMYLNLTDELCLKTIQGDFPLADVDLAINDFGNMGPILFDVVTVGERVPYQILFEPGGIKYKAVAADLLVTTRRVTLPLSEFLAKYGITILCEQDTAIIHPGILLKPNRDLPQFSFDDPNKLVVRNWAGIDLHKESQGPHRAQDSIQAYTIKYVIEKSKWDIIVDDDGKGEIADIVAMRAENGELLVDLTHCKYSSGDEPGGRVEDLYEVCGQAQKSVRWRRDIQVLFRHLIQREQKRVRTGKPSGFMVGTGNDLYHLEEQCRLLKPRFSINISQPGVSKVKISQPQLELLASTEVYLRETANASFSIICNI